MSEFVYLLTNPTIPDLVNIGRTNNLEEQMRNLSAHSGIPVPFECYYCGEINDAESVEKDLHFVFSDHRINPKREFFRLNPEKAKVYLKRLSIRDATPEGDIVASQEEQTSLNRERARRPCFTFSMLNIPQGATLKFIHDETKIATVTGDRKVEYEGEIGFLNKFTIPLLPEHGIQWENCRGPDFWIFENETLTERRLRLEAASD